MSPFQFKQFAVAQDQCAAKIGTDGVLLGAWVSLIHKPYSILDIGTGTGIIALQLSQRSQSEVIDAVELDPNAFEQATINFENSPWNDRLFCYHANISDFASEMEDTYELIVTNPPYYEPTQKSNDAARDLARFEDALPFTLLLDCTKNLLDESGQFATIIPYSREDEFLSLAAEVDLFPNAITRVRGMENTPIKRSLMQFSRKQHPTLEIQELVIEKSRHVYTVAYQSLVKNFYLKM